MFLKSYCKFIFLFPVFIGAQVGIGTTEPKGVLDVQSTNSGVLFPRISDVSAIASPEEGMIYYDSNNKLFTFYNGVDW